MESSTSEAEWNANCDRVKAECGGYPEFWFKAIVMSGLVGRVSAKWGSSGEMRIRAL